MKKIIGLAALVALVAGCGEEQKPTGPKFATNLTEVTEYLVSGACEHIGAGDMGDYVLKCAPSDAFAPALAAQKTARILSANVDVATLTADTTSVYVNVVATEECPMRVVVAGEYDLSDGGDMYAAIVCPEGTVAE